MNVNRHRLINDLIWYGGLLALVMFTVVYWTTR